MIRASSFSVDLGLGAPVPAELAVVAYLNRTQPAKYTAEETEIGPLVWTGAVPGLYTVRDTVLKAPEDEVEIVLEHQHAHRGEIDLSIAFRQGGELSAAAVEAVRCTLFATMSLLNLQLADFLTPVAPVQIRKVDGANAEFASNLLLAVRKRRQLQTEEIGSAMNKLADALTSKSNGGKLRTALELYGSHFFERQARTRFLLLVIALEALATPSPKHQVALALLEKWKTELESEMTRQAPASDEHASLEALLRELLHRRDDSIRNQVRILFRQAARSAGEDPLPLEQRALHVYDTRSALVHDGSLPPGVLDKVEAEARELLEYLLTAHARGTSVSA